MSAVFLRAKSAEPQRETPPTLAKLHRAMLDDPPWARGLPLEVDEALFIEAETEMKVLMKARGYSDIQRANMPERNFLLFGIPVICRES